MGVAVKRIGYALLALGAAGLALTSCGRSEADYQKLLEENEELKAEIAKLTAANATKGGADGTVPAQGADVDVNIDELWAERFDDNEFRSRQRLADKVIRVTGKVDSLSENSLTLLGTATRFGNIRMRVNLKKDYAAHVGTELASLEVGSVVTVQGTFQFDRIWLTDAVFVDERSGEVLLGQKSIDQDHVAHGQP
jgi:hypothetical protein